MLCTWLSKRNGARLRESSAWLRLASSQQNRTFFLQMHVHIISSQHREFHMNPICRAETDERCWEKAGGHLIDTPCTSVHFLFSVLVPHLDDQGKFKYCQCHKDGAREQPEINQGKAV